MRRWAVFVVAAVLVTASACAPKKVAPPVFGPARFPDFIKPVAPAAMASTPAALEFERGWQFLQRGDFKAAERSFGLSLKTLAAFYPAETGWGYLELARRDPAAALPHFEHALDGRADAPSALVGRGEALVTLGREPEAIAMFEAAVAADPALTDMRRRVDVMKFRGAEHDLRAAREAAQAGRLDEAATAYRAAVEHSPDSAILYRELATIERQLGDPASALDDLRHAATLDPTDAASLEQAGELLEEAGDLDGALQAFTQSAAIEPSPALDARLASLKARAAIARLPKEYRAIDAASQITRADLAALIGIRLGPVLQSMRARTDVLVTDVRGVWAETWIVNVTRRGVMEPLANHAFQPKAVVRRLDLAQSVSRLLARLATPAQYKVWQAAKPKIADLPASHMAYPAVALAIASGVMPAGAGAAFLPNRVVTGKDAIAIVEHLQTLANLPVSGEARP